MTTKRFLIEAGPVFLPAPLTFHLRAGLERNSTKGYRSIPTVEQAVDAFSLGLTLPPATPRAIGAGVYPGCIASASLILADSGVGPAPGVWNVTAQQSVDPCHSNGTGGALFEDALGRVATLSPEVCPSCWSFGPDSPCDRLLLRALLASKAW